MNNNNEQYYHQHRDPSPSLYTLPPPALEQQYPGIPYTHARQGVLAPARPQTQPQVQPQLKPQTLPQPKPAFPVQQSQTLTCVLSDEQDLARALDFFSQFGKLRGFRFERLRRGTKLLVQYKKETAMKQALEQCKTNGIVLSVNSMPFLSDPTILVRANNPTLTESLILPLLHIDQTSVIRTSSTEGTGYLLRFRSEGAKTNALRCNRVCIRKVCAVVGKDSDYVKVCPTAPLELEVVRKYFEDNYGDLESITSDKSFAFTLATREQADKAVELGKQVPPEVITVTHSKYNNTKQSSMSSLSAQSQQQKKAKQKKSQQRLSPPQFLPQQLSPKQRLLPLPQTQQQRLSPKQQPLNPPHPSTNGTNRRWDFCNYVGNIPSNATDGDLMTAFAEFKPIGGRVLKDKNDNPFGVVGFNSEEERAAAASAMDKALWNGQSITCKEFQRRKQRASTPESTPELENDIQCQTQ